MDNKQIEDVGAKMVEDEKKSWEALTQALKFSANNKKEEK